VVVLTAAVRDLARSYPGHYEISVDTGSPEVWLHNPYIQEKNSGGLLIDCADALIDRPGLFGRHYVHTYLDLLNERLGTSAELSAIRGDIHLSDTERSWYSDVWALCGREIPFWIICSGGKFDLPIKWWSHDRYQGVVDALRGKIQFVQVGSWGNYHPPLRGAIDLRGKTSVRDLIRLVYQCDGVLCGVTSLMHLAAAVPRRSAERNGIIIAGDREPKSWEVYPGHIYLDSGKDLPCASCWNHRIVSGEKPGDGECGRVVGDLPECLNAVRTEQVIAIFEELHRTGRIEWNQRRDANFAVKAIKNAAAVNDFDVENVNDSNAASKAAEFLTNIPGYPSEKFSGRGIVICAGGVNYFAQAWVCIRMLRQLRCCLPIELWHFGREEVGRKMQRLVEPFGVKCIDAFHFHENFPMRNPLGFELKCYAILHSCFREVLSLDADNVPIVDPTFLFDTAEYQRSGAIFWPDYGSLGPERKIWKLCDVPYREEPEFESGQTMIHKERCWEALNLAWWYNNHSEFFYNHIHGDKDTFHMAWRRTRTEYSMPSHRIESLEGVMCQHDFEGRRIFQHRNSHKWSFNGENKRIGGYVFEEDCLRYLDELKQLWDGTIS
jgi:hypothetical protein